MVLAGPRSQRGRRQGQPHCCKPEQKLAARYRVGGTAAVSMSAQDRKTKTGTTTQVNCVFDISTPQYFKFKQDNFLQE